MLWILLFRRLFDFIVPPAIRNNAYTRSPRPFRTLRRLFPARSGIGTFPLVIHFVLSLNWVPAKIVSFED